MGHRGLQAKPATDGERLPRCAPPWGIGSGALRRATPLPRPPIRFALGQLHRNRHPDLVQDRVRDGSPPASRSPAGPGSAPAPGLRRELSSPELICSKGWRVLIAPRAPLEAEPERRAPLCRRCGSFWLSLPARRFGARSPNPSQGRERVGAALGRWRRRSVLDASSAARLSCGRLARLAPGSARPAGALIMAGNASFRSDSRAPGPATAAGGVVSAAGGTVPHDAAPGNMPEARKPA